MFILFGDEGFWIVFILRLWLVRSLGCIEKGFMFIFFVIFEGDRVVIRVVDDVFGVGVSFWLFVLWVLKVE